MVDNCSCDICNNGVETEDHIVSGLELCESFLGASRLASSHSHIPRRGLTTMLLLCFWQLWKHRHDDVVSRGEQPSLRRLMTACKTECLRI
ncbi:hypothetical protein PVAP13_8KG018212 [Panicum virgatum]|uniref:Uncharacterized protein n=1 Tax=Panicum virgatum TaxID=38727 RepID=A0A8T0PBM8_PANVG|nr:hypothetical protein PVAP13_8KG018212 [Panicum virgatum]